MKQKSFKGKHFIIHLNQNMERLNSDKLQDYHYSFLASSEYVYAPMSKEELKGLADFIYQNLENN
jgi:hypothetical protein